MNRKEFLQKAARFGLCSSALLALEVKGRAASASEDVEEQLKSVRMQKDFIENWLSDLLDAMDTVLDEETKIRLFEGCGRGCYRRHQFKQDIAANGRGSVEKLIEAMKNNFEIWPEGSLVHIRYGEVSKGCYCPVLHDHPYKENDLHCNCTKATHQSIFEAALGRPVKVEIVESVRRGGKTCHFVAHVEG